MERETQYVLWIEDEEDPDIYHWFGAYDDLNTALDRAATLDRPGFIDLEVRLTTFGGSKR